MAMALIKFFFLLHLDTYSHDQKTGGGFGSSVSSPFWTKDKMSTICNLLHIANGKRVSDKSFCSCGLAFFLRVQTNKTRAVWIHMITGMLLQCYGAASATWARCQVPPTLPTNPSCFAISINPFRWCSHHQLATKWWPIHHDDHTYTGS